MIIAVLNQKGGVGKTTLAVHLCAAFAEDGTRVLLIDADPQGSSLDWAASREAAPLFGVVGLPKTNLHKEIPSHAANYDHVVIDGPPRSNELTRSAIMAADLIVIPIQPSPYDVWATAETVEMVREARAFRNDLGAVFAINRKIVNTVIGRDVRAALASYEVPTLEATVCQRVSFAESAAKGRTVIETAPGSLAACEIKQLAREILCEGKEVSACLRKESPYQGSRERGTQNEPTRGSEIGTATRRNG